jgi:PST family polysaccharide transporter
MAFARILRSSALMGGASVASLAAGFVRAKAIAWVAGPAGIGLMGICGAFSGNLSTFAGWGLGTSGVRLIAGAADPERAAKVAAVRAFGRVLAWGAFALTLALFWPVARATFGSGDYTLDLLLGGLAAPLIVATATWTSILQAHGRLRQLAFAQVAAAAGALGFGLPLILVFGLRGIAASLLLAAAVPAIVTWRQVRALDLPPAAPAHADRGALIRMGLALMLVGLLSQLAAYAVRLLLSWRLDLAAVGNYQAALSIAGSLPGFVYAVTVSDFFPRVAAARDEAEAKTLAEKQIQAGLLLALPLLALLLTTGRTCVHLLYKDDPQFEGAVAVLRWMNWGVFLRVLAWPLGFWLLARGSAFAVVLIEGASAVLMGLLAWWLISLRGLEGSGLAFLFGYAAYLGLVLGVARWRAGAWLDAFTLAMAVLAGGALWAAEAVTSALGGGWAALLPVGLIAAVCLGLYLRALRRETPA